jgi:hypothetical protein
VSYIRCLSNPEALYIWGDVEGFANICHNVKPPLARPSEDGNPSLFKIPTKTFEAVALKWAREFEEDVEIDGFRVREVTVFTATGRIVPAKFDVLRDRRKTEWLIKLSYKRHFVHLWRVTWEAVVRSVEDHQPVRKKRAKK